MNQGLKEQEVKATIVTGGLEVETPATVDTLNKVKYQDLLETFTTLGVPEAWKPGSKRTLMIATALEKLSIIRDLEQKGLEGDELVKAKEIAYIAKDNAIGQESQKEALEKATKTIEANQALVKEVESKGLSKEDIEKNLINIDSNLKNVSEGGRVILLKKRKVLKELLEKQTSHEDKE